MRYNRGMFFVHQENTKALGQQLTNCSTMCMTFLHGILFWYSFEERSPLHQLVFLILAITQFH